jgi:hypothetical protein
MKEAEANGGQWRVELERIMEIVNDSDINDPVGIELQQRWAAHYCAENYDVTRETVAIQLGYNSDSEESAAHREELKANDQDAVNRISARIAAKQPIEDLLIPVKFAADSSRYVCAFCWCTDGVLI